VTATERPKIDGEARGTARGTARGSSHDRSEVVEVVWDLGVQGAAVLLVMSLAFGAITQVVFWNHATRWLWLITAAAMFVVGLFVSEGLFGWATEEELQPNIEGLSFDEVAVTFLVGIVVVLVARGVMWRRSHRPGTA
jgi:hypothetical protein